MTAQTGQGGKAQRARPLESALLREGRTSLLEQRIPPGHYALPRLVFFLRRRGSFAAAEKQTVLVLDDPLDNLAAAELHGLGDGGGEVDVPLLTVLALDELHFGGESHKVLLISSYITRYPKAQDRADTNVADSPLEEKLFQTSQRAKHERRGFIPGRKCRPSLRGFNP